MATATTSPATAQPRSLNAVNVMPAPTWSWLKMNGTTAEVPAGLAMAPQLVELAYDGLTPGAPHAFDRALDDAAARYEHLRRASAPGDAASIAAAADSEDALDVPALSTYQRDEIELEETYTPARAFAMGLGTDADAYLRHTAGPVTSLVVMPRTQAQATIHVTGTPGAAAVAATDVIVADDATLNLVIALDGVADGAPDDTQTGLVGSSLRVLAGPRSRVAITTVQTADDAFVALDDTGLMLETDARVTVRHTVLGAGQSFTGLTAELAGDNANITVDTSYLGARAQTRDFGYEIRHRGLKTVSELDANGVLAGASRKCLRGTIDLIHGCKGSTGSENETVLLADERVKNKTVPVILCDEDDVAGNHGATIGHVRPEQLFYLESRGVSPEAAEALFLRAKLEDAALSAPDDQVRAAVCRLGRRLFDDFEEDLA